MSRIDWFIGFTPENFKKTTAKLLTKSFWDFCKIVYWIGNNREEAYAFLNLSLFPLF